jgi:SAM-dependent methyltransferase
MSSEIDSSRLTSVDGSSTNSYKYNATDDGLAAYKALFTSRVGNGSGDMEEDFFSALDLIAGVKSGGNFLDLGTGLGRIVAILQPYARRLVGLEPDRERFEHCHAAFNGRSGVEILNLYSSRYLELNPQAEFDLVTAAMVLQHVSTPVCHNILADIHRLIGESGLGIISTTHFPNEVFIYQTDATPRDPQEFDAYASDPSSQHSGIPVRQFSRKTFLEALAGARLKVLMWKQFSYVLPDRVDGFSRLFRVDQESIRDCGVSQFAIVRRA